jgi:hypothetical protein
MQPKPSKNEIDQPPLTAARSSAISGVGSSRSSSQPGGRTTRRGPEVLPRGWVSLPGRGRRTGSSPPIRSSSSSIVQRGHQLPADLAADRVALQVPADVLAQVEQRQLLGGVLAGRVGRAGRGSEPVGQQPDVAHQQPCRPRPAGAAVGACRRPGRCPGRGTATAVPGSPGPPRRRRSRSRQHRHRIGRYPDVAVAQHRRAPVRERGLELADRGPVGPARVVLGRGPAVEGDRGGALVGRAAPCVEERAQAVVDADAHLHGGRLEARRPRTASPDDWR